MTSRMAALAAMLKGDKSEGKQKKTAKAEKPREKVKPAASALMKEKPARAIAEAAPGQAVEVPAGVQIERAQPGPRAAEPYERYEIGPHVLYRGDARDVLAQEGIKANLIVSDPPYKLTSGGRSGLMRGIFDPSEYNNNGNIVEGTDAEEDGITWPEIFHVFTLAIERGHIYCFSNDKNLREMLNAAHDAGFGFHNMLDWDKRSAVANRWYMKNKEFVGFFYAGKARAIRDKGAKQTVVCPQVDVSKHFHPDGKNHRTEKPALLMEYYIQNSCYSPEDIVLDPFAGSGSTGVGAVNAGVRFIGIEKSAEWFGVMRARLEDAIARKKTGGKMEFVKPEQMKISGLENNAEI